MKTNIVHVRIFILLWYCNILPLRIFQHRTQHQIHIVRFRAKIRGSWNNLQITIALIGKSRNPKKTIFNIARSIYLPWNIRGYFYRFILVFRNRTAVSTPLETQRIFINFQIWIFLCYLHFCRKRPILRFKN